LAPNELLENDKSDLCLHKVKLDPGALAVDLMLLQESLLLHVTSFYFLKLFLFQSYNVNITSFSFSAHVAILYEADSVRVVMPLKK
jgi:hypothetical protein